MKITVPEYYKDFCCIGGQCEDTCCAGWEVVVDETSAARFLAAPGELGQRLKEKLQLSGGEYTFPLENGRCPFLNEQDLCDIQTALGEAALCRTCRMFPRFEEEYGDLRELGLSFSCPEAARIMLRQAGRPAFTKSENDEPVSHPNDFVPDYFDCIFSAREEMFRLIFDETFSLPVRVALLLIFAEKLQKTVKRQNTRKAQKILEAFSDKAFLQKTADALLKKRQRSPLPAVLKRLAKELEFLKDELPERFLAASPGGKDLGAAGEQLLFYLTYRYFLKGLYDKNLYSKMAFAVFFLAAVQSLAKDCSSPEELQKLFILCSKELEHSEENLLRLEKLFLKNRLFSRKDITSMVLDT